MRRKIFIGLFALLVFLTLILANTLFLFYDTGFSHKKIDEIGPDIDNAKGLDKNIREYLVGENNTLESDLLNEREIKHLDDVKRLFTAGKIILSLFIFLIAVGLFEFKANEFEKIGWFLGGYIAAFVIISLIVLGNFELFFNGFHLLLFDDFSWLMEAEDKIIQLYPNSYFVSAFFEIAKRSLVTGFIGVILFHFKYLVRLFFKIKGKKKR